MIVRRFFFSIITAIDGPFPEIEAELCGSCSKCYEELACPAIINLKDAPEQELKIDLDRCVRCGVCNEICPNGAIQIHQTL